MNNLSICYLIKANAYAEKPEVVEFLDEFYCKEFRHLEAYSMTKRENDFEIHIEAIVEGNVEDCLTGLKKLNYFLSSQNEIESFGYSGISTIPATYEVIMSYEYGIK